MRPGKTQGDHYGSRGTRSRASILALRAFHNFNVFFRDNSQYEVVAFTATQIPNIQNRRYPRSLAGLLYSNEIPIIPEEDLSETIRDQRVDLVVFSYSDVSHEYVMHKASEVLSSGASFMLLGPNDTMLKSSKPLIAICAGRTGSGKSQTTRRVVDILRKKAKNPVVVRHPMPYGNLLEEAIQRFERFDDLDRARCTIEEREEYEPHLERGIVVFAGVDYSMVLKEAEKEADVIVWDGGNNDFPFFKPDLLITVVDPMRPGDEIEYHPGETNVRMADIIIVNKVNTASERSISIVMDNVRSKNPNALIVRASSEIYVEKPEMIRGKRALVIEDGPTITHGGMSYGAGYLAARQFQASEIVNPIEYAVGSLKRTFESFPHVTKVLPAMGYGPQQMKELEETIDSTPADVVVSATPIRLNGLLKINKAAVHVRYELKEIGLPNLEDVLTDFLEDIERG